MTHYCTGFPMLKPATILSLILVLLCPATLPAQSTAEKETLIVYSGRAERLIKPVIQAFTDKTGIRVELLTSKTAALINRLTAEGDRTPADVLITNDAGGLEQARKRGIFRPFHTDSPSIETTPSSSRRTGDPPHRSQRIEQIIPSSFRAEDNTWIGLSGRVYIVVYNTKRLPKPNLHSVLELADPQWKGNIAIHHAGSEYLQSGVSIVRAVHGDETTREFLRGLKENAGNHVYGKSSQIVNAVARGDVALGLVNHYYIYRHLAKHPDASIAALMPDQDNTQMGALLNVAGIGIIRQRTHPKHAERFVEFLVSEEGQNMFARLNKEFPLRAGVPKHPDLKPLEGLKTASVPLSKLGTLHDQTLTLMESVGMR